MDCVVDAAMDGDNEILEFEIATRVQERKRGLDDLEMRLEAASEGTAVDVIKLVGENPRIFCIVDFEGAICRNTRNK